MTVLRCDRVVSVCRFIARGVVDLENLNTDRGSNPHVTDVVRASDYIVL